MVESLIPVAPGLETPLEMLEACHERVEAQLQTLGRLVVWLPGHGADEQARKAAVNVMRYFDVAAVNHHMDEEEDLIPVLRKRATGAQAAEVLPLLDWVLEDHQLLFGAWSRMRQKLERIARGEAVSLRAAEVEGFASAYRQHIAREEAELIPWARRLLGEEDIARMSATMIARRRD